MVKIDVDENLAEDLPYVLTATVSDGAGNTDSVSFSRKVLKAPALTPEAITQAPVAGTAYKYHVYQSTLGKDLYFAGQMDGYYYMTTESYEEAVDVYAEYVEGSTTEFYLYFNHNVDGKQYFGVQLSTDGAHDNIVYTTTPVSTFVWNEKLETVTTHLEVNKQGNAADYYFGNYASHDTISASMISYAGGAGNNVGHLVEMIDKNDVPATKKIAAVKEALDVQLEHKMDKTLELTTLDERFADVAISWSVSETTAASIADNVLSLTIPAEQETVTLTATLTCGEDTDTKVFELVLGPKVVSPAADATAAEIVEAAFNLAKNEALEGTYTLTGVITKVNTAYSADYQNVTVTISVEDKAIECFRLKGEGADVIKAGDTITVTGSLKNYNGKVEFDSGCTLDSYVVGEGTPDDGGDVEPSLTTPEEILTALYALADGESLTGPFTLTGTIDSLDNYSNPTIVVKGFETMPVYCYKLKVTNAVGDVITVTAGSMKNYQGTYEFMDCTLVTENEGGEGEDSGEVTPPAGGEDSGEGEEGGDNETTTITTIAGALAGAEGDAASFSGTVSEIYQTWNEQYSNMSFYVTDGTDRILVFRAGTKVGVGDAVEVSGTVTVYNSVNQIAQGATVTVTEVHTCSSFTEADCYNAAVCNVCNKVNGEALGHADEDQDEICDRCKANLSDAVAIVTASKSIADLITANGWTSSTTKQSFNLDDVVSVKVNGGNNSGKAYNGDHIRIYATDSPAGTLTISVPEGYELVSVKVTAQTGTYAFLYVDGTTTDICNVKTAVSGTSVLLNSVKNGSDGKQVRVTAIEVEYKAV